MVESDNAPTLHRLIVDARTRIEGAGVAPAEAALDAELLAREALGGWERGRLLTCWREPAPPGFASQLEPLVARRERREPVAYITGHREFWGLEIDVEPGVLIPRPETELIVEEVLARTAQSPQTSRLADVGTGSGCLAVALARWLPSVMILATDVSESALAVARRNVTKHDVADRVTLSRGDLLTGHSGPFDVIVSNPPYIPSGDLPDLQPEIRMFEPETALVAGADGLDVIRRLVPHAADRLASGGWLFFEFGFGQAAGVRGIIQNESRFDLIALREDLAGIPRVAIAQRKRIS